VPGIWQDLELGAPEIARLGMDRIRTARVALLGTLRADASPRISPIEPYFVEGQLLVGAMTWSRKAADLLRDPRYVLHSAVTGPDSGRQMTSVAVLCLSWRRRCGFRGRPEGPASQDWLRDHQPPLQVVSGCYDLSFQVEEAEAYRRDVPGAEVYALDAGHFAVDAQPGVIADLALGFLQRRQARTDG
jgi:pimeloyl-ACP methyl ester carboxylesterase